MTIDSGILRSPESRGKIPFKFGDASNSVTSEKYSAFICAAAAWYGFWLVVVLALYWPVLPALPYRDHPYLMLNHQLAYNDWQWFWSMLSANRAYITQPGDFYAFRPAHMAIICLQDIFLRYNLLAQGAVSCLMFSFAATVFCSMAKRFVGVFSAVTFTFLWVSQPVGATMVMWQHIAPYILCPAFLVMALRVLDGDDFTLLPRIGAILAACFVFAATLHHEIGIASVFSLSMFTLIFCRKDTVRRRKLLWIFLLPLIMSILVNLTDYFFIHPTPPIKLLSGMASEQSLLRVIVKFVGAIGAAFIASPLLNMGFMEDGLYPIWKFYSESPLLLTSMAVLVSALLLTACIVLIRELRNNGFSQRLLFIFMLLSFFLATFAVCAFRMYSRDPEYMDMASYYYTFFSLALSGIVVAILPSAKKKLINIIAILCLISGATNVAAMRTCFSKSEAQRRNVYSVISEGRKFLLQNNQFCFNGDMPLSVSYGSLFYDLSCSNRPEATPLYIRSNEKKEVWLTSVVFSRSAKMIPMLTPPARVLPGKSGWIRFMGIPYGHSAQFTVNKVKNFSIILTDASGVTQAFTIDRNILKIATQNQLQLETTRYIGTTDKDSAAKSANYRLEFTPDGYVLFADDRLISRLPAFTPGTTLLNMVLRSSDENPADVGNMFVSEQPSPGSLQLIATYKLTGNY